jgi:adenylate cyclase, class 2
MSTHSHLTLSGLIFYARIATFIFVLISTKLVRMREIEVKLKVKSFEKLEQKLKEKGCVLSEPISQHDVIYSIDGSGKIFGHSKEGDVIIRIRYLKDRTELNLKKQCSREMDNIEHETEIKNPEEMDQILKNLGWIPAVEVKKFRRKGKFGQYEICLDQVEKLGTFVELEKLTSDNADPEEVRKELFMELESLGLSRNDEEAKGYDTQMYNLSSTSNL